MLRFSSYSGILVLLVLLLPVTSQATSNQYGDTGLLSQPTAQTLNEGNICVGLWANCSERGDGSDGLTRSTNLVVPTTITMGLGTFMEVHGSYPNLLFNGQEDESGQGFASAGFKFRIFGKRSASFRLATDVQARLTVSDNPKIDGLTDYVGKLIATYKKETLALHVNAGYAANESPDDVVYDDQIILGGGVEYSLATRLRLIAEFSSITEKSPGQGPLSEVTAGLQYFVTPHLTMNLGASFGIAEASPAWRVIMGLSTCQGVGTYNRPIPQLVDQEETVVEPVTPVKVSKIRALSPLVKKISITDSPTSHLEVPVNNPDKVVIVDPADRLHVPEIRSLEVSPLGPIGAVKTDRNKQLPEQPFPAKVRRRFRFPELSFAFNQWSLSDEGRKSISLVAEELRKENKYFIISIEGHTDDVGSEAYNQTLSFKRAVSAATHMVLREGADPARIFVKGYGESRPIDDNATDAGRTRNRRVELLILVPEGYEELQIDEPKEGSLPDNSVMLQQNQAIDPLAIEQAIIEKTGAETAKPAGAFSQLDKAGSK